MEKQEHNITISIALASYNGSKHLREQLESIQAQTYHNFELIVCDDCSSDNTWQILEEYALKDKRMKIFKNECNLGFKKNFEKAILKCQGEYIALSDQDDIWTKDHLQILFDKMVDPVQIVCGRPLFVDEKNNILPKEFDYLAMAYIPKTNEDHARHIFLGQNSYQGASMLIRKSFINIALPIPNGSKYHDNWFAALACFAGGLEYVNKIVMRYRRIDSSVTFKEKHISSLRRFIRHVIHCDYLNDRMGFISEIQRRLGCSLTPEQKKLLSIFRRLHTSKGTFFGKIYNTIYRLFHFRVIYAGNIWN